MGRGYPGKESLSTRNAGVRLSTWVRVRVKVDGKGVRVLREVRVMVRS